MIFLWNLYPIYIPPEKAILRKIVIEMGMDTNKTHDQEIEVLEGEHSLIIVSGEHIAKMYEYQDGRMTPEPVVFVGHTEYSDTEGFRGRDNGPASRGTPSDYEHKDTGMWQEFSKQFKSRLEEAMRGKEFDWYYLFAPQEIMPQVKELLPKEVLDKLRLEYAGNFTKFNPSELEEKIKSKLQADAPETWTERADEARSILDTPTVKNSTL